MCRRRYSECRLRCFATTCKLSELSRRPFSHGCVLSDCLCVSHTATWLKPAVRVVGVGPRCGTPANASASAASNVLHVTRLLISFIYVSYLLSVPPCPRQIKSEGHVPLCAPWCRRLWFQFSLETINCLCHHRIIIQHIPLGHHSMREEIRSNIFVAPTFNQLQ